ncbi:MAG: 4'-phosphopantetheinyl transferase superfamily protein [Acidobacteria bacterium]|nr:4'-phosphopantetheinyl transferase superfamily protein [Acidobacteriota bacterium]
MPRLAESLETPSEWKSPPDKLDLTTSEVHIWRARLDAPPSAATNFHNLLSADERERAARFRFDKHRRRFTVARGILRTLLGRYLEREPQDLTLGYSDHGKPFLAGTPEPDLRFNLSHSHDLALFAFTAGRDIGIDVEQIRPDRSTREIAERFFSRREVEALFALPTEQQTAGFFRCWTRKEAYIKAKGKGMSIPLNSFAASLSPEQPASLLWVQDHAEEPARWILHEPRAGSGFAACLAAEHQPTKFQHWSWGS